MLIIVSGSKIQLLTVHKGGSRGFMHTMDTGSVPACVSINFNRLLNFHLLNMTVKVLLTKFSHIESTLKEKCVLYLL